MSKFGEKKKQILLQNYQPLTKALLQVKKQLLAENELKKLKTFDLSYFIGKSHFEETSIKNYLVFQLLNKYFKVIASINYVSSW